MRFPWRRDAVEAALALQDTALAAALAAEQLELARRWDIPSARGIALCTQGLATGGAEGLELLERGVALLSGSPARLDHVRALVDLGTALRRAGRRARAREPLQEAIQTAQACGASALAARAHEELLGTGARPRRLHFTGAEALTAGERRVATLAAQGQSNRQIAAALYITVRTVENHLAGCYRKLGISSRRDLPGALGADRRRAPARGARAPAPTPAPAPASRRTAARAPHSHSRRPAIGSLSASISSVNTLVRARPAAR